MKRLLPFVLIIFTTCSEESVEPDPDRVGFNYFPLEVGLFSEFNVTEIEYEITGTIDTSVFQLRSVVVDSFENQASGITYILHRLIRENEAAPWQFSSAWTTFIDANNAVVMEENIPFVKLAFPVDDGKEWDGNVRNTLDVDLYAMDSLGRRYVTPTQDTISNTVTVVQSNNEDFIIQLDTRAEIYGSNIGLVYRKDILLNYCTENDCIGQEIIESGHSIEQVIYAWGKE